ncbi:serine/threonine-protein kinase [Microtetraspora sp. NBRC 16547]|uniref:serine/threonine-protein kinase n=1 Tax=Microtetraspora sp. NBRC 16547 TaxID=3030993 RepID=UPI0024A2354A|nr:serine/threonine-protein kinase [Microtetraspora sp. NBRC 16547]GLW97321.1 serine/threonine protein kinase [Microtetraspora sp. NBRC 16547]
MEAGHRVAGRYHLLEPIGRGGMGVVWRAHDELLDRAVAVKEVLYQPMSEEDRAAFNRRTIREARAAGRISHPNVIVVHDVIEEDGRPWIIMQLVRSRSLGQVIREHGPLVPERVASIGLQVLDALCTAHAEGVLHRDVKPENVLLADDGRVVLTDFGIATMPEEAGLTMTGVVTGTPAYLPPERLNGDPATPESDLWSLGATIYAAVEGRAPFDRTSPIATMAAVLHNEPDPVRRAGPLAPVIEGLLDKDPGRRIDAVEAAELLRAAASGTPGATRDRHAVHRPEPFPPAAASPGAGASSGPGGSAAPPSTGAHALDLPGSGAHGSHGMAGSSGVQGTGTVVPPWNDTATALPSSQRPAPQRPEKSASTARVVLLILLPVLLVVTGVGGWYGYQALVGDAGNGSSPSPSATPTTGNGSHTPTASPSSGGRLPRGWAMRHDRLGFSIAVPQSWTEERDAAWVRFRPPGSKSTYLMVDFTRWVDTDQDPMLHLQQLSENPKTQSAFPGYERTSLQSVVFQRLPAADWEFTWQSQQGVMHVLDRSFLTSDRRDVAIYWQTSDSRWAQEGQSYFAWFAKTFRSTQ